MAHPSVTTEMIKVQPRIVADFFAVVLVSVATEDYHVRTHENGSVEGSFERNMKIRQSAARVEQFRPMKKFQVKDEESIAELGEARGIGGNATVNNQGMAVFVINHAVSNQSNVVLFTSSRVNFFPLFGT